MRTIKQRSDPRCMFRDADCIIYRFRLVSAFGKSNNLFLLGALLMAYGIYLNSWIGFGALLLSLVGLELWIFVRVRTYTVYSLTDKVILQFYA